jgi:hypothetical protein
MNQPRRARRAGAVRGRALLLSRLVQRDIRHHLAQALLLVVAIAAATATLTMALALTGVTSHPYAATRPCSACGWSRDDLAGRCSARPTSR